MYTQPCGEAHLSRHLLMFSSPCYVRSTNPSPEILLFRNYDLLRSPAFLKQSRRYPDTAQRLIFSLALSFLFFTFLFSLSNHDHLFANSFYAHRPHCPFYLTLFPASLTRIIHCSSNNKMPSFFKLSRLIPPTLHVMHNEHEIHGPFAAYLLRY